MATYYEYSGLQGVLLISSSITNGEPTGSVPKFILQSSGSKGDTFQILIPTASTGLGEDIIAFHITSSGRSPFVGVGTDNPQSTFDIKEVKDDAQGSKFFLRSARPTKGANPSDAAGTIQFIIDSGSYNDLSTSGSVASITTDVLSITDEGAAGNLLLKVASSEKTAPEEVFKLSARYNTDGHELTGKLQISNKLTVNSNISASGAVTASSAKFGDTSVYIDGNGGNITASANISASGALITGYLTASNLNYPDTDGLDRQVLKTDGLGNLSFGYAENVEIALKNVSGGTINKGTPCFITASGTSGNVAGVIPADAGDPTKMPVGVIAGETMLDEAEGLGLVNGFIQGVDTSTFASGDTVYVAVGGGYTNVKPTGSLALVQKLGNVEKVDASNGSGVINGPGYYNDLPNWEEGKIQVGTSTYPVTSSVISLDEANTKLTIEGSGSTILEVVGSEGQLFSITDSLSGSLFAVSDVSGLPILEVFSDDTVKIGTFNDEAIIVNGNTATITGSFTGSFIGDGSGLTGVGTVDTTGTPANNQISIFTDTNTIEGDSNLQWDGSSLSVIGDITGNGSTLKVSEIASAIGPASSAGDLGLNAETFTDHSTTVIAGGVYYLGVSSWIISDADAESSSKGFMGVATSTNSNTGMVVRGVVYVVTDPGGTVGSVCYLSTVAGRLTTTAPTATGDVVRVMGYKVGTNLVYFNPSPDYIVLS